MKNDKKILARMILGLKDEAKAKSDETPYVKGTGEESGDEEEGDGMDNLQVAAEDIIEAIKNEEPKKLAEALKAFIEMCE